MDDIARLLVGPEHTGRVAKLRVFETPYVYLSLGNEDDLYITVHGLPFIEQLMPGNWWLDKEWFRANATRLSGTSTIYRVRTKPINGRAIDIVLKWNRMGQDIPGEGFLEETFGYEFNSPFEEFSLLMELRNTRKESPGVVYTHKPLAIYVPGQRKDLDKLGRKDYKMMPIVQAHEDLALDMYRSYAVVYEWVKGIDAVQAADQGLLTPNEMSTLTLRAEKMLAIKGFVVHDRKPHHLILRPRKGRGLVRDRQGEILYALVDFELLKRTPERERIRRDRKRKVYLERQRGAAMSSPSDYPPHLSHMQILGVDYVYGNVESTQGKLWVLGNDPELFDYFLPERWETTPRVKLRTLSEVYQTTTKENIRLVWKVSKVGSKPDIDPFSIRARRILAFGYNSPFEEIALASYLRAEGISTISPKAVYMAGYKIEMADFLLDTSRYALHEQQRNPDGTPILRSDRSYVTLWEDWGDPDERSPDRDHPFGRSMSALHAFRKKLITDEEYFSLMNIVQDRLRAVNVDDLNPAGSHFLVSFDSEGDLIGDDQGQPAIRVCEFELLRRSS